MSNGSAATLTEFVTALADRARPATDPDDLPIVVLWGARGSKSSAMLEHLHTIGGWHAPRARLDGARLPDDDMRPHLVANRLAFELGQQVERFGRARFPRFFLGMIAVRNPLDPDSAPDARLARAALLRLLLQGRPEGRRWLRETVQVFAALAGLDAERVAALDLAMGGVREARRTLALLKGAGLQWYGEGLGRHFDDAADAVVTLSVAEFERDHDFVDRVLCRAFMADLRAEFASGSGLFFLRRKSALVLLDNVGKPPLSRFVSMLSAVADGSGPLLVVAASHQRFPEVAAQRPDLWQPDDLGRASRERWSQQRDARRGSRYYPVRVDPIDDVPATARPKSMAVEVIRRQRGLSPAQDPTVAFARRLTSAHPAGMDMVFRALAGAGRNAVDGAGLDRLDLRGIFAWPHQDTLLDEAVFDLVLGPWTEDMRPALALMGIAVDLSDASVAAIQATENQRIGRLITEFTERDLWVIHRVVDGRAGPPRLHPFARRAIAHRLGRADGIAGHRWETAHALLRDAAAARGDEKARIYHDLALGRIGRVAAELSDLFDPEDPRGWYDLLLQVTGAPLRRPDRAENATAHLRENCPDPAPDTTVTGRLVAALQLHTDPLGDPVHEVCAAVSEGLLLGELYRTAGAGKTFLQKKSRDFDDCWTHWHPR